MEVAAAHLRPHHFSFVRAVMEGIPLRRAWAAYMAFEGGPDDERHFRARLRQLVRQIAFASEQHGLQAPLGALKLNGAPFLSSSIVGTASQPEAEKRDAPLFATWVQDRCNELGIEEDYQTHAEWLSEYEETFGFRPDQRSISRDASAEPDTPRPATAWAEPLDRRPAPLDALNQIATVVVRLPRLEDPLASWLAPGLVQQLKRTPQWVEASGQATLGDLIGFINQHRHRWWTRVPRLGRDRAERIVAWLAPLADNLGRPLHEAARVPFALRTLASKAGNASPASESASPSAADCAWPEWLPAPHDRQAAQRDWAELQRWLDTHRDASRTHTAYRRVMERFHLWCWGERQRSFRDIQRTDVEAYTAFLTSPPAHWIETGRSARNSAAWRPLKGGLGATSLRLEMTVLQSFFRAQVEAGCISTGPFEAAPPLQRIASDSVQHSVRRLDDAQWAWVRHCWHALYRRVGPAPGTSAPDQHFLRAASLRRTRLVLELAGSVGLSLRELVGTRCGSLHPADSRADGPWLLTVTGRRGRTRDVMLEADIKQLLDRHHLDMGLAETTFHPRSVRLRSVSDTAGKSTALSAQRLAGEDEGWRPLIGALRPGPPRWELDARGHPALNRSAPRNADRFGALDPVALHQALKRFFRQCASLAETQEAELNPEAFHRASLQWLRGFFEASASQSR